MTAQAIARDERAHAERVGAAIDTILAGDVFNGAAISALANRLDYPVAASRLMAHIPRRDSERFGVDPLRVLHERTSGDLRLFRLAVALAAIPRESTALDFADLRQKCRRSKRGRAALALWGECDWPAASTAERAAYALAALVKIQRERSA